MAARHAAAILTPRTSHCALEYFRWAVRSQGRPDGTRFARAVARPIDVPVVHLLGAEDPWIPEAVARASARWAADHRLVRIPGAGHFPHQEAPRHVTEELLRSM